MSTTIHYPFSIGSVLTVITGKVMCADTDESDRLIKFIWDNPDMDSKDLEMSLPFAAEDIKSQHPDLRKWEDVNVDSTNWHEVLHEAIKEHGTQISIKSECDNFSKIFRE